MLSAVFVFSGAALPLSNTENNAEKEIYLTFDDGPSASVTEKILDILKTQNIKASFFAVGENITKNPQILKRIYNEGHTVGVHCFKHNYKYLYKDAEIFKKDIKKCLALIHEILPSCKVKYMRFPGGSFNIDESYILAINSLGLKIIDWNCINGDAQKTGGITQSEAVETAICTSKGKKKAVLLMHDNKYVTAAALERIILHFKTQGYTFKKL